MTTPSKPDISTEADIEQMVNSFYQSVQEDELLDYVFNDFAQVDWDAHLPIMYRFWNSIILGKATYRGNPFAKHIPLPIHAAHFERWVDLFVQNIDSQFQGDNAELSKHRAKSIAHIFQSKLALIKN